MAGLHSVWVYPDPAAGGWSPPLASNPYFTSDGAGWRAIPFGSGWSWANGSMVSTNPAAAYQALGRDPAYPVGRPAAGTQWRIRADVTLPAPPSGKTRVYLLVRFGRTPNDAFQTAAGPNAASLFTWRDLGGGSHRLEAVFAPAVQPNPEFLYLSPQVTVDPTSAPVSLGSIELAYTSGPGSDISCLVDSVSIQHGRDDTSSQPEASAATLDLTSDAYGQLPPGVDVGAAVTVTSTVGDAISQRFVGRITDVTLGWDDAGEATPDSGVGQIVAVGPLADLGRRVVGDVPWPTELDGARVNRVMTAAGITLDPFYSDPGTVQILARDVDSTPALDAARDAATSASGVVWETRGGEIRYSDAEHRRGIPSALTLDACDLLVTPSWRRNLDGLVNEVSIGYGVTPEGGEQPRYVESNAASLVRWGHYGYTASTALAALVDAQTVARLLLARNSSPVWVMAALPVDTDGLDEDRYLLLLGLDVHSLVTLTGLPAIGTAPTSAALWVEGYREVLTYGGHEIELVVSGYCRTAPPPRWDDLDPSWQWDALPESLTWDEAACLGPPVEFGRWNDQPASLRWDQIAATATWDTY